ncbi:hypothetical protein GCM10010350_74180 [Streptomyces galilaeus]|nr:hypothetical protein GCM10010350_74180 [Streptomyces galilaeus]
MPGKGVTEALVPAADQVLSLHAADRAHRGRKLGIAGGKHDFGSGPAEGLGGVLVEGVESDHDRGADRRTDVWQRPPMCSGDVGDERQAVLCQFAGELLDEAADA